MKNYYEILEVSENASKEVIENSYKTLKNKYQPQNFEGDAKNIVQERIKDINEAYSVISDEFLRNQYESERQKETEIKTENIREKKKEKRKEDNQNSIYDKEEVVRKKSKVGTAGALGDVTKQVFANFKDIKLEKKTPTKKGILALLAAIGIVVIVGVILWFIPATNGFIKSFLLMG